MASEGSPRGWYRTAVVSALLLLAAASADAELYFHVTFEEPVHHLDAMPTLGDPPDKITAITGTSPVYGRDVIIRPPTVLPAPAGMTGQALKLTCGRPSTDSATRSITLSADGARSAKYTVSFDLRPELWNSSVLDVSVAGAPLMRFEYNGNILLANAAGMQQVGTYRNDTLYRVTIEVDSETGLAIGRLNGSEIWRAPAGQPGAYLHLYCFAPFPGVKAELGVYLDNIVIHDNPANQAPSFTKGADVTVEEDAPYSQAWASDITPGTHESYQSISFQISNDNPALFAVQPAISPAGVLSFTPAPDASGVANLTVRLSDNGGTENGGADVSAPQTFAIEVQPVNDPPTLSVPTAVAFANDGLEHELTVSGISTGAANETEALEVSVAHSFEGGAVFEAPTVSYTSPATAAVVRLKTLANTSGRGAVFVTVKELSREQKSVTARVNVLVGNSSVLTPDFTRGGNVGVKEDSGSYEKQWATHISNSQGTGDQTALEFIVQHNASGLFSAGPAISPAGVLTFRLADDANGTAEVSVTLRDHSQPQGNAGSVSPTRKFTITVGAINDPPSFVAGPAVSASQLSGAVIIPNWATQISGGPPDEATDVLSFEVLVNRPELFAVQPAITASGTLTFTPARDMVGLARLTISLSDRGFKTAAVLRGIEITASEITAGNYVALVQAPAPAATPNDRAGLVKLTITRQGQFTGRIILHEGQVRTFRGAFGTGGNALFAPGAKPQLAITARNLPPLALEFSAQDTDGGSRLNGTLSSGGAPFAEIAGGVDVFVASKAPVAPFRSVPPELLGVYNVALTPQPVPQGTPPQANPRGSGYGTVRVNRDGTAILVGRMSDDREITYAGPILGDQTWPIYIPSVGGKGSLSGFVQFRDVPEVSDLDGANLSWSSPATRQQAGWEAVRVSLVGSKYGGEGFAGLMPPNHQDYMATLGSAFPSYHTFTQPLRVSGGVTPYAYGSNLRLKIDADGGFIHGSFTDLDNVKSARFRGVIISKQSSAFGYFSGPARGVEISVRPD